MRHIAALLVGLLLASLSAHAQVTSTRETAYDWACCEDQQCVTRSVHQRFDSAFTACLNKSMVDGKPRWVQGGRYRMNVAASTPPPPPTVTGNATLSWIAPSTRTDGSPLTNLAGYRIRYGTVLGNYPNSVTISGAAVLSHVIDPLAVGTWHFVIAAYDANGLESLNSNPVSKAIQ